MAPFSECLPKGRLPRLVLGLALLALCGYIHFSYSAEGAQQRVAASLGLSRRSSQKSAPAGPFKHPAAVWGEINLDGPAIISMASGYGVGTHKNFAGSLRKSGYEGDIVLLVESDIETSHGGKPFNYLKSLDVTMFAVHLDCPSDPSVSKREKGCLWQGLDGKSKDPTGVKRPIALIRYSIYLELAKIYNPKAWILLSDYRDVFFQDDPFKWVPKANPPEGKPLWVFEEDKRSQTLGSCPFNRGWITSCWGHDAVDRFVKDPIRCSGSTMGTGEAIVIYNEVMAKEMEKKKCHGFGQDQGYHNYLIISGAFQMAGVTLKSWFRGDGPVNTVGLLDQLWKDRKQASLAALGYLDDEKYIVNNDNKTRSACIHQWDRFWREIHTVVDTRGFSEQGALSWYYKRHPSQGTAEKR